MLWVHSAGNRKSTPRGACGIPRTHTCSRSRLSLQSTARCGRGCIHVPDHSPGAHQSPGQPLSGCHPQAVTQPDVLLQGRALGRELWSTGTFCCRRSYEHGSCARPISAQQSHGTGSLPRAGIPPAEMLLGDISPGAVGAVGTGTTSMLGVPEAGIPAECCPEHQQGGIPKTRGPGEQG